METKTKEIGAEKIEDLVRSYINRWSDGLEMIQTATAEIGAVMTRQVLVREKIDKVKRGGSIRILITTLKRWYWWVIFWEKVQKMGRKNLIFEKSWKFGIPYTRFVFGKN
jgi:hypothetical protein